MQLQLIRNQASTNQNIILAVQAGSIQLTSTVTKEVGTLQFNIEITPATSSKMPALNDQIDLYAIDNNSNSFHYFGGNVTEIEVTVVGGIQLIAAVTVTDWSFVLNKRVVAKNYAQMDPADIVTDLINNYAPAGFSLSGVQRGNFLVPSIKFNYEQLFNCLQKLATLIGWNLNITPDKVVQFFVDGTLSAPFGIDDTTGNQVWNTLDWDQSLMNMKNSVFVIGGNYNKSFTVPANPPLTYSPVDTYTSIAGTFVYPLAYPYEQSTMVITLAGVSQSIGTANVTDPGTCNILYSDTGRYIQFTSDPGDGNAIVVQGTAKVPITAYASDPTAIALYGQIDESIVDKQITTVQEAFMRAQAEVAQFGEAVSDIKFNTLIPGLFVGQQITFNSTKLLAVFGQSSFTLIIKRITAVDYSPTQLIYSIECIETDQVTFNDIMSVLLQQENAQNPTDDSTVTETLVPISETLALADTVTAAGTSAPYQWGGTPQVRGDFSNGS